MRWKSTEPERIVYDGTTEEELRRVVREALPLRLVDGGEVTTTAPPHAGGGGSHGNVGGRGAALRCGERVDGGRGRGGTPMIVPREALLAWLDTHGAGDRARRAIDLFQAKAGPLFQRLGPAGDEARAFSEEALLLLSLMALLGHQIDVGAPLDREA